jgi:flavin-dependent dehydrogenase
MTLSVGYFVPGAFAPVVDIRFYRRLRGYLWWFPRKEGASLGIVYDRLTFNREDAKGLLRLYLSATHPETDADKCVAYGAPCPSFPPGTFYSRRYQDDHVALIGDSAGLADPVTGEGIRYALYSAKLLCDTIIMNEPRRYYPLLARHILPELDGSARWKRLFYQHWFLSLGMAWAARSQSYRAVFARQACGGVGVHDSLRTLWETKGALLLEAIANQGQLK